MLAQQLVQHIRLVVEGKAHMFQHAFLLFLLYKVPHAKIIKRLGSVVAAIVQQIEVKNYAAPFAMDKRTVVKLGINFSSKTRGVESWKQG